jgi:hypothetical protein
MRRESIEQMFRPPLGLQKYDIVPCSGLLGMLCGACRERWVFTARERDSRLSPF